MKVSILIVSHAKDLEWLGYCLKSILKFASGFHKVMVAWPRLEQDCLCGKLQAPFNVRLFYEAQSPLGQLHHQVQKCCADVYCPDSDFVVHVDSDCIFTEPVTPADYFVNDKPVLLYRPYSTCPPGTPWQAPTERALGFSCPLETMQRHPAVHYRYTYEDVRAKVEEVHRTPFAEYVLSCKPDFPQGFTEFNTLGSYVMRYYPHAYHAIDVSKNPHPHSKLMQFWSHGPMDQPQDIWHEGRQMRIVPIEEIRKAGLA